MNDIENNDLDQHDLELQASLAEYRKQRLFELLLGPVVSLVVHLVAIAAMIIFMVPKTQVIQDEVVVQMEKEKEIEIDVPDEPEEIIEEEAPDEETPEFDQEFEDVPNEEVETVSEMEVVEPVETKDHNVSELKAFEGVNSMDNMYNMRTTSGKNAMGRRFGGKYYGKTKAAVIATLRWMKKQQTEEGSWPGDKTPDAGGMDGASSNSVHVGITGLGILTYLANGVKPDDKEFGYTLEAAASWLRSQVDMETGLIKMGIAGGRSGVNVYQQAIATYAICEFYGMTQIPTFKPVMDKMVEALIKHQRDDGSWAYQYNTSSHSDASLAGWHAQALKAAYSSGCKVEGLEEATQKISKMFLTNVITDKNNAKFGYGYYVCDASNQKVTANAGWIRLPIGAVSSLCLQLYGEGSSLAVKSGYERIKTDFIKTKDYEYINAKHPRMWHDAKVYDWYYQTQVVFQYKEMSFGRKWNAKFIYGQLCKNQVTSKNEDTGKTLGYWRIPGSQEQMDKEREDSWRTFYATALNCLTLQVYYRNLPTSKKMSFSAQDTKPKGEALFEEEEDSDDLFD